MKALLHLYTLTFPLNSSPSRPYFNMSRPWLPLFQAPSGPLNVIGVYVSPNDGFPEELLRFVSAIILGDFNARHTDFDDKCNNIKGRIMTSLLLELPLIRLTNTFPTYISPKTLLS